MLTSFYTGISGLNANAMSLNVVGNNLANVNTVGFKHDVISFTDVLSSAWLGVNPGGNPMQTGLGTRVGSISGNFSQGSLKTSTQPNDVAIIGNGFFIVNNGESNVYTRAGNFTFDAQGRLVTQQGFVVQGWMATGGVVNPNTAPTDIVFSPGASSQASPTTTARLQINLDAQATAGATSDYSTSATVYDSLGAAHTVTFTFEKSADLTWACTVTCPDATTVTTTPTPIPVVFNDDGTLDTAATTTSVGITLAGLPDGAADLAFNWEMLDTNANPMISQYAAISNTSKTAIDGYPTGNLSTFGVDSNGYIQGIFSNGQVTVLGQLAMATFSNPQGLVKTGDNSYAPSYSSGQAAIGSPGSGGRGAIQGNALELSNVDIATEFTQLIVAQRGYQANSRVITTSDEVTQEAVNLKR